MVWGENNFIYSDCWRDYILCLRAEIFQRLRFEKGLNATSTEK